MTEVKRPPEGKRPPGGKEAPGGKERQGVSIKFLMNKDQHKVAYHPPVFSPAPQ